MSLHRGGVGDWKMDFALVDFECVLATSNSNWVLGEITKKKNKKIIRIRCSLAKRQITVHLG